MARKRKRRRTGWTLARRVKQSEAIKRWAPWQKSTGPRTIEGKARSSMNLHTDVDPDSEAGKALMAEKAERFRQEEAARREMEELDAMIPAIDLEAIDRALTE